MVTPVSIPLFLIGFPVAFAGWRMYEAAIMFFGGVAGLATGFIAGLYVTNPGIGGHPLVELHTWMGVAGGVAGVYVAYMAHRLVHGITGFAAAALIGYLAFDSAAAAVFLGLGGGYASWLFHKISVIVLTATIGGLLVSIGFGVQDTAETQLLLAGAVALLGMVVQFGLFGSDQSVVGGDGESMKSCPNCGHPCEPEDAYCQGCGAELRLCGSCGRIGLRSWAFCDGCGQSMTPE